jgi:hypothetical protein
VVVAPPTGQAPDLPVLPLVQGSPNLSAPAQMKVSLKATLGSGCWCSLCLRHVASFVLACAPASGHTSRLDYYWTDPAPAPTHQGQHSGRRGPIHPIQWVVLERASESTVRIGKMVGWCPAIGPRDRPRITGVRQVDRARAVTRIACLFQRNPSQRAGVEAPVEAVVHIRHGLEGRPLYDRSRTPPVLRWPR